MFYRSLAATVRVKHRKHPNGRTETAFSYGNHATFASKMLLDQLIESIKVGDWTTLELVELTGPRWMASDSCVEACSALDQLRAEQPFGHEANRMSRQARVPPSIREDFHQ